MSSLAQQGPSINYPEMGVRNAMLILVEKTTSKSGQQWLYPWLLALSVYNKTNAIRHLCSVHSVDLRKCQPGSRIAAAAAAAVVVVVVVVAVVVVVVKATIVVLEKVIHFVQENLIEAQTLK
ncbi:hypothetical protein ElyMa_001102700 [Elysia marginata]|uniref:Uncharacterized protein n=1 Tax=Elysia marginata TaxID=1093978 RepID=A0AAV4HXH1_9GAST|nr:hypothetical protein ElyMa_001102700 [Elysia marginata]